MQRDEIPRGCVTGREPKGSYKLVWVEARGLLTPGTAELR